MRNKRSENPVGDFFDENVHQITSHFYQLSAVQKLSKVILNFSSADEEELSKYIETLARIRTSSTFFLWQALSVEGRVMQTGCHHDLAIDAFSTAREVVEHSELNEAIQLYAISTMFLARQVLASESPDRILVLALVKLAWDLAIEARVPLESDSISGLKSMFEELQLMATRPCPRGHGTPLTEEELDEIVRAIAAATSKVAGEDQRYASEISGLF